MQTNVYMNISFPNISLEEAERIKKLIVNATPPGESFNVYFSDPIVSEEYDPEHPDAQTVSYS